MSRPAARPILISLGIALAYVATAKLGFTMAFVAEQVTVVWPPTGIALAALLLWGFRVWPGVFVGALIANATSNEPLGTALGIAIGNTLEAVVAVWILRRFLNFQPALNRVRDVVALIGAGAIVGTAVSATLGVISLCLGGVQPWDRFGELWFVWWLGDGLGALIVAPLLLIVTAGRRAAHYAKRPEFLILSGLLITAGLLVFAERDAAPARPLEYVFFPFIIWGALRFGPLGSATASLLSSIIAVWATSRGFGPLATGSPGDNLVFLQLFMAIVSATGLLLAAAISETRSQNTLLQAVTEGTSDSIYVKDAAGRYLMMNPAGARMIGRKVEDVIGHDDTQLLSEDTALEMMAHDRRVMETGIIETTEEAATAAGTTRTYLSTKGPYRDVDSSVIGVIGISRDLTEQKKVREALRLSEQRYRSLVLATSQVVWNTTASGDVVEDLPTWTAFTGQSKEELLGRGWAKMLHPDDVAHVSQVWEESLRTGKPHSLEFRVRTADGDYRYVQSRAVPVLEADGAVREWVGTLTDITENKLVEEERLRLYFLASENNRLKDEFLAMLAHELRNPLSAMRNAVEVMRIATADESLRTRTRDIIDRQVSHLTRLVDDLLDVSRVTQGKIQLRLASVELSGIVWSSVEVARPSIESRRQKLTVRVPESGIVVRGDATRLEQVLINLLQNAAKYSNTGGSIEISLSEAADKAVLRVKDDGIGISADLLPRIFDLFAQDNHSAGRSEGGLGIGLTIARNLIEMHGGTLRAFSDGVGKGSQFVIELPVTTASVSHPGLRGMVIDDNFDSAEALSLMLNLSGHTVRVFHNGRDALHSIDAIRPHFVLLDIGLPGMDGFEIASRIRRLDIGSNIRLIAVTGYGEPDDRLRGHRAEFDHYLIKPVDPNALGSLLRGMFGTGSRADVLGEKE